MSTEFAYLPPLPPIAATLEVAPRGPGSVQRGESLLVAITSLLAGISASPGRSGWTSLTVRSSSPLRHP